MGGVTSLNQSSGCVRKVGCLGLQVSGFSRWSSSGWDDAASTYISCEHLKAQTLSRLPRLVSANTLGTYAAVVP